jgi:hypothetical protein
MYELYWCGCEKRGVACTIGLAKDAIGRIRQKENIADIVWIAGGQEKKMDQRTLSALTLFSSVCMVLALTWSMAQPTLLCERWGGEMYSDGRCHMTANLSYCVQQDNSIRLKTMYDINLMEVVIDEKQ